MDYRPLTRAYAKETGQIAKRLRKSTTTRLGDTDTSPNSRPHKIKSPEKRTTKENRPTTNKIARRIAKNPTGIKKIQSIENGNIKICDSPIDKCVKTQSIGNNLCDSPTLKKGMKRGKTKSSVKLTTYKKYGVFLPSMDEILKEQKDFQKYKAEVETALRFNDPFETLFDKTPPKKVKNTEELLDCKHLTITYLTESFKKNLPYITDIYNGKIRSERHVRYHHYDIKKYGFTTKDLSYNTSMIVYTDDQIDHMVSLMQEHFDPEYRNNITPYFFKVLLPELCLKIFMDTYKKNKQQAEKYLETRPVDGD